MKIVKFKDGKYGIRKFDFLSKSYKFLDPITLFWWPIDSIYINDCKGGLKTVKKVYDRLTDIGTPIRKKKLNVQEFQFPDTEK